MPEPGPYLPEIFWQRLKDADQKVMLLDYDGTLAPFQLERDKAFPYPGIREKLEQILKAGTTRVIIVSGRTLDDLLPLLGLRNPPEIWGSHGFERRLPDGTRLTRKLDANSLLNLKKAVHWIKQQGHENAYEEKPASVAFHWRGVRERERRQLEDAVRAAWTPLTAGAELEIHPFDGGLELRCVNFDKGRAVQQVLAECGGDFAMAYLGDDRTDEDAFRALKGNGLSVLVRETYRDTLADCWLRPPAELLLFLENWLSSAVQ